MKEYDWLACRDATLMLDWLGAGASRRKQRLFGCACCRRIWPLLVDERSRRAVETAEAFADGRATVDELATASAGASAAYQAGSDAFYGLRTDIPPPDSVAPHGAAICVSRLELWSLRETADSAAYSTFPNPRGPYDQSEAVNAIAPERAAQTDLLRDIFGNPFRSVAFDPSWLTSDVVALARGIYEERAFDRMPVLADALQDAGCDNEDVLDHCRDTTLTHVRGCWVVDLVLGKE